MVHELGLIVLDEEHDGAFKQSDGLNYHARDMAVVRARFANARVILSSATPSVESRNNANLRRYSHVMLTSRFADAALPDQVRIARRALQLKRGAAPASRRASSAGFPMSPVSSAERPSRSTRATTD